jgi:hypothetical protein
MEIFGIIIACAAGAALLFGFGYVIDKWRREYIEAEEAGNDGE